MKVLFTFADDHPDRAFRQANPGYEFYFLKSVSFVMPTDITASNLREFAEGLEKVTADSIYFHMFEARLRLRNFFSIFSAKREGVVHNLQPIS